MSLRSNGSYIGPRPTGPNDTVASGIWDLRTVQRQRSLDQWPGQPVTDPDFASVVLLLHADGSNGSTTITDSSSSAKTVTAAGNAQISTTQSQFGGSSLRLDGTGDAATIANSSDWRLVNGDFTVEMWIYPLALTADRYFLSHYDFGANQRSWRFGLAPSTSNLVFGSVSAGGTPESSLNAGAGLTINTWQHIAISKSGATSRIFIDGVLKASTSSLSDYGGSTAQLSVGSLLNSGTPSNGLDCYIDDLRITKGVARYTAAFTPPTAAFPDA